MARALSEPAPGVARRVLRNAASILLGDGAGDVLSGYAIAVTALALGPRGFGTLREASAFMDLFEAAAVLGLGHVALRFAASRGGCDGALRGTVFGLRMSAAVVAASVGIAIAFLTQRRELLPLLLANAGGILLAPASMVALLPFQWHQSVHRRIAVPPLLGGVRLAGAYAAAWLIPVPLGFQLAVLGATAVGAVLNSWWARRLYPDTFRFDRALAWQLLKAGWPMGLFGFIVIANGRAAYFLLRPYGPDEVGQYAAADGLVRPMIAVATAIFVSMMPAVSQMAVRSDYAGIRVVFRRTMLISVLALAPVLGLAWWLSAWLLHGFAPAYAGAIWPFRVLAAGTCFIFLNIISMTFLTAMGRFRTMTAIAFSDLVLYLLLSWPLVRAHGALGAALSTTLMEAANVVVDLVVIRRLIGAWPGRRTPAEPGPVVVA